MPGGNQAGQKDDGECDRQKKLLHCRSNATMSIPQARLGQPGGYAAIDESAETGKILILEKYSTTCKQPDQNQCPNSGRPTEDPAINRPKPSPPPTAQAAVPAISDQQRERPGGKGRKLHGALRARMNVSSHQLAGIILRTPKTEAEMANIRRCYKLKIF